MTAQDTITALGLLANAGIRGSDAGTLIKTSLQAITDQGNPAQGAIESLGLTLYDTTGKFVGYRSMLEQVAAASKRMTEEEFQADTNILFGSDAMRAAMVAAGGGVQMFDEMFRAVGRAGGASEMAAAQMQGLPGVVEGLKNTAESAKLALYDLVSPSLQSAGRGMTGWLDKAADAMRDLRTGGGGSGTAVDQIRQGWRDISSAAKDLAPSLAAASKAIAMGAGATAVAGWRALGFAMQALEPPLKLVADILGNNQWLTTGLVAVLTALYLKSKLTGPALQVAAKATQAWGTAFAGADFKALPNKDINFTPARVVLQDFTGVPCVVDLAAMRDAMKSLGGDMSKVNPLCPVELVIDHSVMVDEFGTPRAFQRNVDLEYARNMERYQFLKWGQGAFNNFRVVPPGTGICHQVNLEYIGQGVWSAKESGAFASTVTLMKFWLVPPRSFSIW